MLLMAVLTTAPPAAAQQTDPSFWMTDGPVLATAVSGNTLYIGGNFTYVGPYTGGGVPLETAAGGVLLGFPRVRGEVYTVAPDESGGWFVGGVFDSVGGFFRRNLAHIAADLSVSAWAPNPDSAVYALATGGAQVYAGGRFASIGGQARSRIAALDAVTGQATAWDPNANGPVYALAVNGGIAYAGGAFTLVGGQGRSRIAALDVSTGLVSAWNPNANGAVYALAVGTGTVYAGGDFTLVGGLARNQVAALDSATGAVSAWNPNANGRVRVLAVDGNTVYAGGDFFRIGGRDRMFLAALDDVAGQATTWNPGLSLHWFGIGGVYALEVGGGRVYAGGAFTSSVRENLAAWDAATGQPTSWAPSTNYTVRALGLGSQAVYAGGSFSLAGGQRRYYAAAIDRTTGRATGWDPLRFIGCPECGMDRVNALAVSNGQVYMGGYFLGVDRILVAADSASGAPALCEGNGYEVRALAASGTTVFVGGLFFSMGGQPRNNIAELDAITRQATPWDPNANGQVNALAVSGGTVYAGGSFTSIGGQARNRIAALDAGTGQANEWNPNAGGDDYPNVAALVTRGSTVYAGGRFTSIGGQARNRIAALDAVTGQATLWDPDANSSVDALTTIGYSVYAGGSFTSIGGQARNRIAALDAGTGQANEWNPNADGGVTALAVSGPTVYAGGSFTSIGGNVNQCLAAIHDPYQVDVPQTSPPRTMISLHRIIPNPVRKAGLLVFDLPGTRRVSLEILDLAGRRVRSVLRDVEMEAGLHRLKVECSGLTAGAYWLSLRASGEWASQKFVVLP